MFRPMVLACLVVSLCCSIPGIPSVLANADRGILVGRVCDTANGVPLAYANVVVLGTMVGCATGADGGFRLEQVPLGRQRVQVSYVGYDPVTLEVTVRAGQETRIELCPVPSDAGDPGVPALTMADIASPRCGQMWTVGPQQAPLPLRSTDVDVRISGIAAHVTVEQRFHNASTDPIEAVYVFPLPHRAAVHAMSVQIGERRLQAEIRKRAEAQAVYAEARDAGRTAALLEQERPNIFTQQVANIMPGHDIVVRIEYAENVAVSQGRHELVVPTVVAPRFIPGNPGMTVTATSSASSGAGTPSSPASPRTGWSSNTDQVPDAARITPFMLAPGQDSGHRLAVRVALDAGVPLDDVWSTNHAVLVQRQSAARASMTTRPSDRLANKDFVLRYSTERQAPEVGLLVHRGESDRHGYFQFVLQPPPVGAMEVPDPRELLFVVDTSGSMRGAKLEAAKGFLRWALRHLNERDSFNIVVFANNARAYSPGSLVASPDNLEQAVRYLESLRGGGGTHMRTGLEAAFVLPRVSGQRRTLCLVTDGLVGNDAALLNLVQMRIGDDRLFAVGIGSSPNRHLVDGLSEEGWGAQEYLALDEDPRVVVQRFFTRLDAPALRDLSIDWDGLPVQDVQPAQLFDLFEGQVLRITGRYRRPGSGTIVVRGRRGDEPYVQTLKAVLPKRSDSHAALRHLWARQRIHDLARPGAGQAQQAHEEIEALGLEFALLTDFTSFVVTDNQVVQTDGQPRLVPQPVEMPQGLRHESFRGTGGLTRGVGGRVHKITVTGDPKKVDRTGSCVSHVTRDEQILTLPVESVESAESIHVRSGRSSGLVFPIEGPRSLQVAIDLVETTLNRGRIVQLRIRMKNNSAQEVRLPQEYRVEEATVLLEVSYDGQLLPRPELDATSVRFADPLQPGEEREYLVPLNGDAGYVFDRRGRYEIRVLRLYGAGLGKAQTVHFVNMR